MGVTTVRLTKDNENFMNEAIKTRGDQSKIMNDALKGYFLPKETEKEAPLMKIRKVEL